MKTELWIHRSGIERSNFWYSELVGKFDFTPTQILMCITIMCIYIYIYNIWYVEPNI